MIVFFFSLNTVTMALAGLPAISQGESQLQLVRGLAFDRSALTLTEENQALSRYPHRAPPDGSGFVNSQPLLAKARVPTGHEAFVLVGRVSCGFHQDARERQHDLLRSYVEGKNNMSMERLVRELEPNVIMLLSYKRLCWSGQGWVSCSSIFPKSNETQRNSKWNSKTKKYCVCVHVLSSQKKAIIKTTD